MRLEILGSLMDTSKDDIFDLKLSQAEKAGLRRLYPFGTTETVMPVEYDDWVIRAAVELYNKMGVEGEASHAENGVSRTYDRATGISRALLSEIVQHVGIMEAIVEE